MQINVSVIIPVYNMEKFLPECLNSIVDQTLKEIEIIAVNDGSTDNSLQILKDYQKKSNNIIIINQENQGAGPAKNKGIQYARGKYIIIMDPDDYYPSNDCLEALYEAAEREGVSICGGILLNDFNGVCTQGYVANHYKEDKYTKNRLIDSKDYPGIYHHQRYLFSRELIINNEIYFPAYRRFEDPPFTVKALGCAEKIYEIDKVVYMHRVGYKKIKYTFDICKDIIFGIRDVFQLVIQYNLNSMYINSLVSIIDMNAIPFYLYGFKGIVEIDEAIKCINLIRTQQSFIEDKNILLEQTVREFTEVSNREYERVYRLLNEGRPILLYGTGDCTSFFLDNYSNCLQNVIGIAVTNLKKDARKKFRGFIVKQIEEYRDISEETCVFITTMICYHDEIKEKLIENGFKDIIPVNKQKLELVIGLREI